MIFREIYKFLSSVKLALTLLIVILSCCLLGVTIWRGADAGRVIFGTLWFNGLLVLLVANVAFCFFPRMWGRKLTVVSLGMILFHLSFVAILGGIVYNSLFYFRGQLRLTEGETLPNGDPQSYDFIDKGRYFNFGWLRGETTLVRMHTGYKVGKENKEAAYEIAVGEGVSKKPGIIYVTHNLDNQGFKYLPDREGYSILIILYDKTGRELYGAHVPLQSLKQKDGRYLYTTGTKYAPGSLPFPQNQVKSLWSLQVSYRPEPKKERAGDAFFRVWPLAGAEKNQKEIAEGTAKVGEKIGVGDYYLEAKEARYWAAMNVRYEPGKPTVLTSLWVGLAGMILTFIGRTRRGKRQDKPSAISNK